MVSVDNFDNLLLEYQKEKVVEVINKLKGELNELAGKERRVGKFLNAIYKVIEDLNEFEKNTIDTWGMPNNNKFSYMYMQLKASLLHLYKEKAREGEPVVKNDALLIKYSGGSGSGDGRMPIAGLTVEKTISLAEKAMKVFLSSLEDREVLWELSPQGRKIAPGQMIKDKFAELAKAKSVPETLEGIETLVGKLNYIKESYIESLDADSRGKDGLSLSYTVMVFNLIALLKQVGWGALDANKIDLSEMPKGGSTGSPIEVPHKSGRLFFWNHENRSTESLEYVPRDKLSDEKLQAIVAYLEENKSSLTKIKMKQLEGVIRGIKQGDEDLLSRLRFALSEDGSFQGCVEILNDKEQRRFEVSPVIGANQWVEIAMIIAGIQELTGSMPNEYYTIILKYIWMIDFYITMELDTLSAESLPIDYEDNLIISSRDIANNIIGGFYGDIDKQIVNAKKYLIPSEEGSTGSPLTVEDIRKVKVKLKEYAKTVSNFYEGLSSVDLTNGIEQRRFSEDYKNYSRDLAETLNIKELMDAVSIAVELTGDKRPSGYTAAEWQEIYGDLAGLKERIDLTLEKYIAELVELFGDKEEGLYKYFPQIGKDRLDDYNQKYGQRSKLRNIATAIEAANTAVLLYEKGNIDVRERWEDAAAVLKEIDSIIGQWLDNKHKVRSSLSALKRSIEEWYKGLSDDVREKWLSTIRQEMRDIQLPGLTNIQEDISKYDPVKSVLAAIDEYIEKLGKINSQTALNVFVERRIMIYMLVDVDLYLARYQRYGGIEGLFKKDTDKLNKVLDAFKYEMMDVTKVSSALIRGGQETGGIDFTGRAMRLKIERVGSFADLKLVLPRVQNVQGLDLDKEFRQIEAIAASGIVPNSRRILELFSACYSRGEFGRRLPQIISSLKSSSAIQESLAIDSDADFRLALIAPEVFADGR